MLCCHEFVIKLHWEQALLTKQWSEMDLRGCLDSCRNDA